MVKTQKNNCTCQISVRLLLSTSTCDRADELYALSIRESILTETAATATLPECCMNEY